MAEQLQGVWQVQSVRLRGETVHSQQTHLVVEGARWREIWDRILYSDEPWPETTVRIDGAYLALATTWHTPDRPPEGPFDGRWAFELEGDVLRTCAAGYELEPTAVDDSQGTVTTYVRVRDPHAIARISAAPVIVDKPTRHHPSLGELRWDGNLAWFKTADGLISLAIPQDAALDTHANRARSLLGAEAELKNYAGEGMCEAYNRDWREDGPTATAAGIAGHLVLQGITVHEDLAAEAYFEDGGLFGGQIVVVSIDPHGALTHAALAG